MLNNNNSSAFSVIATVSALENFPDGTQIGSTGTGNGSSPALADQAAEAARKKAVQMAISTKKNAYFPATNGGGTGAALFSSALAPGASPSFMATSTKNETLSDGTQISTTGIAKGKSFEEAKQKAENCRAFIESHAKNTKSSAAPPRADDGSMCTVSITRSSTVTIPHRSSGTSSQPKIQELKLGSPIRIQ